MSWLCYPRLALLSLCVFAAGLQARARIQSGEAHVWETQEITFAATREYANPYAEVECWIDLQGPGFAKRVHGFWDGGRTFKVRFVATAPGEMIVVRIP